MIPWTAMAFMVTGGETSIPAARSARFSPTWCFLQWSHFWAWCRIFGRLRFTALGRVFNANLTSCPEHAIMCTEVINTYLDYVNSRKTFADISAICFQTFPEKKTIPRSLAFHQILLKNLFSHCLFDRLLAGLLYFSPFNISTACLLITLPLQ